MTAAAGIPGVPTAALDAITDENTRMVLRAIVDGWQVRNGNTGKGDNRFVTAGELGSVTGAKMIGGLSQTLQQEIGKQTLTPGEISRVISDLQASIIESALWKELGERVTIIDAGGGVGMTEERTRRYNDDNALVTAVNTIWATVGDNSALVQQGATGVTNTAGAVASAWQQVQSTIKDPDTGAYIATSAVRQTAETAVNKAGALEGKYTVKIDVNGYVSGFGLASTANNATPFSEFIVRADRFAIGTPSAPDWAQYVNNYGDLLSSWYNAGQPDKEIFGYNHYINQGAAEGRTVPNKLEEVIPFIVTTTPQTVNGKTAPPGVYIDSAFIKNGTITTANIGLAQVDTLLIQGNAVTVPFFAQSSVITTNATTTTAQAISGSYTLEAGSLVMAIATGTGNKVGSFFGIAVAIYLYNLSASPATQTLIGYAGASFENFATITGQGSALITTTGLYKIEAIVYRTDGTPTIPDMTDVQVKVSAFGGRR